VTGYRLARLARLARAMIDISLAIIVLQILFIP